MTYQQGKEKEEQHHQPQQQQHHQPQQQQQQKEEGRRSIFVTVGTTRFDKLVSAVTSDIALEWMERQGFSSLTIQYGKGVKPSLEKSALKDESTTTITTSSSSKTSSSTFSSSLTIQSYDFRPSLQADMLEADLIISHAGAGTIMEGVKLGKKLVVVINTDLMNNHQTELAEAMASRGHLWMIARPEELGDTETWDSFRGFVPVPHQGGDAYDMPRLLDSFLGFS